MTFRMLPLLTPLLLLLAPVPASAQDVPDLDLLRRGFARPAGIPYPAENGWSEAREGLGKLLFFDPRLSGSNLLSCATCHNPSFAWEDGLAKAVGHGGVPLARATPTVLNLAWAPHFFWDGRAASLEAQALGPIGSATEMNQSVEELRGELQAIAGYRPRFEAAYPGEPITAETAARALATYQRTLVSARAPFDAFALGDDTALSEDAKAGFLLFTGKARCVLCHATWRFTDDTFHDVGVPGDDPGRGAVTGDGSGAHAFKTPTLRNVALRAPYMHDGSEATLLDVIELYDAGGRVKRASLSPLVVPLGLTAAEKAQLVAFLETLTSEDEPVTIPILPR